MPKGIELKILQGARSLLSRRPRPVIMAEVSDLRCRQWDYSAGEIIEMLSGLGSRWYMAADGGALIPREARALEYNFVALPEEFADSHHNP